VQTHYAAYGLLLDSSFRLPGMENGARLIDGLPSLMLTLQEPAELEKSWSGTKGPPEWQGKLGDGFDLTIEEGRAGDHLFTYGDRARFRLDAEQQSLICAPSSRDELNWQRALISKVLSIISVMRGYEALHAAVVDSPDGVVAIIAPSGSGKSTLAVELLRRGWPLFADDILTMDHAEGRVRAHPGTPHMNLVKNLPDATDPQTLGATLGILAGERWLAASTTTHQPRPVHLLCMLERGQGLPLEAHTLPSNPLLLAPYMLGLATDTKRQRSRFDLYADLIQSATLVRLTASLEHHPEQLADLVEQALVCQPEPISEGIE
jgi:hypothetical protein